ncbi:MAG: tyrosine-type recombinase/integrase [Oscillospiraceae bacterium]|nr:tyrosine-type recombinase/integrase [Oscillospiraceae bacterium]
MTEQFRSVFSTKLYEYLRQKRLLGFKYVDQGRHLVKFDIMCANEFPKETELTQKIALAWASRGKAETASVFAGRVSAVRGFARFLASCGINAYIIPDGIAPQVKRKIVAYIFTDDELSGIFAASDRINSFQSDPWRGVIAPAYLRLMYACGMRPQEIRALLCNNVDLKTGVVKIESTKFNKERLVVMDDAMKNICCAYDKKMSVLCPSRLLFFPGRIQSPDEKRDAYFAAALLSKCIQIAKLTELREKKPRPYDFRHTFATKTLHRWIGEEKDLNLYLPYLSAFMGHSEYEQTAYYIHFVPEHFPQIGTPLEERFANLLPEVIS